MVDSLALSRMINRFQQQTGYYPSAPDIMLLARGLKQLEEEGRDVGPEND